MWLDEAPAPGRVWTAVRRNKPPDEQWVWGYDVFQGRRVLASWTGNHWNLIQPSGPFLITHWTANRQWAMTSRPQ